MPKVYLFSGAGISAESGLSTWRGATGMWNDHKISEICDYNTWKQNHQKVHDFYSGLREKLPEHEPNRFHYSVAALAAELEVVNMTQNVDDLFERAGYPNEVIHLHGQLTRMECEACGHRWDVGYSRWNTEDHCPNPKGCSSRKGVKPDVVFFNQHAPEYPKMWHSISDLTSEDVVVVAGTSQKVIDFGYWLANRPGKKIWVNIEHPTSEVYDDHLIGPASETAEALAATVKRAVGRTA